MYRREPLKAGSAAFGPGQALEQTPVWKPKVFNAHHNGTVIAPAGLIIPATDTPGANPAGVNRRIGTLSLLDGYTLRTYRQPFLRCRAKQQRPAMEAFDNSLNPCPAPGQQFFRLAKVWIPRVYYATKAGLDEWNKSGRAPAGLGCTHPQHKGCV